MKHHITSTINGDSTEFLCEPQQSLLEVLRDDLALTGAKEGCNNGNCGACSVIMNGVLVNSCCVLAVEADGATVTTVEGIAPKTGGQHPVQQKFLEHAALQCGICTPGFIVASKALLDKNPHPNEADVRLWLSGNLCRCTGYDKIVRAVLDAANGPSEITAPATKIVSYASKPAATKKAAPATMKKAVKAKKAATKPAAVKKAAATKKKK